MKPLGYLGSLAAFTLLAVNLGDCFFNESGHGLDMRKDTVYFLPSLVVGLAVSGTRHRVLGLCCVLLSALGIAFSIFAEALKIMWSYERWIEAGMPEPTSWRVVIIVAFATLALIAFLVPCIRGGEGRLLPPREWN